MGKAHSNAYRQVGHFFDLPYDLSMHTLCGRTQTAVERAAEQLGWKKVSLDWWDVVSDPEIDIVDIATPGDSHCEIAIEAARNGKIVFCEKPIGNSLPEAKEMLEAVERAGVPHAVFHNYRKAPAVALAKQLIDEDRIGTIYHYRATYLQDWIADPNFPLVWRLQKERAGSGAHGDINAHIIDLARFLVGEISEVSGLLHTFIKERPLAGQIDARLGALTHVGVGAVTVDDAAMFLAQFDNGALGTFEASRFAVGRKNYNRFEINGSKGSVVFNLERMNELEFYDNKESEETHGFRTIQATETSHPYAKHYWPVGHIIGYEHTFINLIADAIRAIGENRLPSPNFYDGLRNQEVLDAVERSSASRKWVRVSGD